MSKKDGISNSVNVNKIENAEKCTVMKTTQIKFFVATMPTKNTQENSPSNNGSETEQEKEEKKKDAKCSTVVKSTPSNYAAEKEEEMKILKAECAGMGFFDKRFDSKVPEEKKTTFNRITFKASDKDAIKKEVEIYETFYKDVKNFLNEEKTVTNISNFRQKITETKQKLSTQLQSAKNGEKQTASSAVYELHQNFIQDYHKLECVLLQHENAAVYEKLFDLESRLNESLKKIDDLHENFINMKTKYDDVCDKFVKLETSYETSLEMQKKLNSDNEEMKETLNEILKHLKKPPP